MRLEAPEVPELPLAAALLDADGRPLASTPEWPGHCPGSTAFWAGWGQLVVAPEAPAPALDDLMGRLIEELGAAGAALDALAAGRVAVLRAALALVSGRPLAGLGRGGGREVVDLARAALGARAPDLAVTVVEPVSDVQVTAPGAIALALVQLAVNAHRHAGAGRVHLRTSPGPTFHVDWPDPRPASVAVSSHRHRLRRRRWGWGYVQIVADALGGSALPPGPAGPGLTGAALGLGATQLTLPVCRLRGGAVERSTLTWDADPDVPGLGEAVPDWLAGLASEARAEPGQIAYRELYRARAAGDRTWIVLAPQGGAARARDLLAGFAHERALWHAPEPHATRVAGLAGLLAGALGAPPAAVPPAVWEEGLRAACAALGLPRPAPPDAMLLPDPRLAALLIAEVGGRLVAVADELRLETPAGTAGHPLLAGLRRDHVGHVRLL